MPVPAMAMWQSSKTVAAGGALSFTLLDRALRTNNPASGYISLSTDSSTNTAAWMARSTTVLDADGVDITATLSAINDLGPCTVEVVRPGYSTVTLNNFRFPNWPLWVSSETDVAWDSAAIAHTAFGVRWTFTVIP